MLEAVITLKRAGVGGSLSKPDLEVGATIRGRTYAKLAYNLVELGGEFLKSVIIVALNEEEIEAGKSLYDKQLAGTINDHNYWFLAIEIPNPKTGEWVRVITHLNDVASVLTHCVDSSNLMYDLLWTALMSNPQHRKRGLDRWTPKLTPSFEKLELTPAEASKYIAPVEHFEALEKLIGVQLRSPRQIQGKATEYISIQVAKSNLALLP